MKKRILIIGIVIFLAGGFWYFSSKDKASPYTLAKVETQDIVQTVSVTGTVKPEPQIDLQFQTAGKIEEIFVEEGQEVKKDELLAELENEDLEIRVNAASANLAFYQANLDKEIAGATDQEIRIAKIKIDNANQDLANSEAQLADVQNVNQSNIASAELKVSEAQVNLEKARSDLIFAERKAADDLHDAETKVETAETALSNAEVNLEDVKLTSKLEVDQAYEDIAPVMEKNLLIATDNLGAVDNILGVDGVSVVDPNKVLLGALDPQTVTTAEFTYKEAEITLDRVKTLHDEWKLEKKREDVEQVKNEVAEALAHVREALDDTYDVLLNSVSTQEESGLTNELKNLKDFIAAEQTDNNSEQDKLVTAYQTIENKVAAETKNVNSAQSQLDKSRNDLAQSESALALTKTSGENAVKNAELAIETSEERLKQAEQSLEEVKVTSSKQENDLQAVIALKKVAVRNANAEFDKLIAAPRNVDLASLQANVQKAASDLEDAQYSLSKTQLKAPTDGVIVKINKDEGENITAAEVFIIENSAELLISANVSETDIGKVSVGDPVTMTFDAFAFDEVYSGEVVDIAFAETVIEGVIYYEVKVSFVIDKEGREVKSGMTANLTIQTDLKKGVLAVPLRAVKFRENASYVQVLVDGELQEKEITIGIEGDQFVEVVSGLKQAEEIVTFVETEYSL